MMRKFLAVASMFVGLFAGPWTGACGKEAGDVAPVTDAGPDGLSLDADVALDVIGTIEGCVKSTRENVANAPSSKRMKCDM